MVIAYLKKLHFYLGLLVLTHFVITGLFMRYTFFSITPEDTLVRMMFRANHIYILFSGLVNLILSYTLSREGKAGNFHYVASVILILATIGISVGFYVDPMNNLELTTTILKRKLTGYSVIGFLVGTGIHLILLQFYKTRLIKR